MLINLRNALMAGKRLPYDAEVEFLESTGTQWVNTGITPQLQGIYKLDFMPTVISPVPWGCQNFTEVSNYGRYFTASGFGGSTYRDAGVRYATEINGVSKQFINNGVVSAYSSDFFKIAASGDCWLFGRSDTGVLGSLRIYSAQFIDENGVLVRDFIPVRKKTVGYLYDRVSGKLFGNAGTGDFVLGPDVVPVEYLASTGTQWVNIYTFTGSETSLRYNIDFVITQDSSSTQDFVLGVSSLGKIGPRLARYSGVFCYSCDSGNVVFGQPASLNQRYEIDFTYNSDGTIESSINGGAVNTYQRAFYSSQGSSNYLFGMVRNSTYGMIGRVYRMKMWADSILVRNFIPVRVGTDATSWEGAMMDVLTRRIYRNQGTGAFTYGNDLNYPIPA